MDNDSSYRAPLFRLGRVVTTPGAMSALGDSPLQAALLLARHVSGDWGDVCDEDSRANDKAVELGFKLLSVYATESGARLWIITDWDRSTTTLLTPAEY